MAKLPRGRARRLTLAVLLVVLAAAAPAAASAVDLAGTWHVLVHYTDANKIRPEQMRWDDRIWIFEPRGERLRWIEYPIVVFSDESGRFENLGTNRARRVAAAWEPDAGQFEQIVQGGLEVNSRGKRSKLLHREDAAWRTRTDARVRSASTIAYVQHWSVEGDPAYPVFRQEDQLGSERTDTLDGVTIYTTTFTDPSGNVLRGTFERDGTRRGTFRMVRAAPVTGVKGSGKTQGERLMDAWWQNYVGSGDDEEQEYVRRQIRHAVEQHMRERGLDPGENEEAVEALTRTAEIAIFDEGRSIEEVSRLLRDGKLAP